MSQLPIAVESPAERVITEGGLEVKVPILAHSNLKLIFSLGVGNDLPVMNTLSETFIGDDRAEQVLFLSQEQISIM